MDFFQDSSDPANGRILRLSRFVTDLRRREEDGTAKADQRILARTLFVVLQLRSINENSAAEPTRTLELDFTRMLERDGALPVFLQTFENMAPGCFQHGESLARVEEINQITKLLVAGPREELERQARRLAFLFAELAMDCLAVREASGGV